MNVRDGKHFTDYWRSLQPVKTSNPCATGSDMWEFREQLMPQPDDSLDFSHKQKRSHTIEKPHSAPIPVSLLEWLAQILRRLQSIKAQANSEENEEIEDKKEE